MRRSTDSVVKCRAKPEFGMRLFSAASCSSWKSTSHLRPSQNAKPLSMDINTSCSNAKLSLAFTSHRRSLLGTSAEHAQGGIGGAAPSKSYSSRRRHQLWLQQISTTPTAVSIHSFQAAKWVCLHFAWFSCWFLGVPFDWYGGRWCT
jgi:hypothetical protein